MLGSRLYDRYLDAWRMVEPQAGPEWENLHPITQAVWVALAATVTDVSAEQEVH